MVIAKRDLPFIGFVVAVLAVRALPASIRLRQLGRVAAVLGEAWYRLQPSEAALTRGNLQLAFGAAWSDGQVRRTARAVFRCVALRTLMQDIVADLSAAEVKAYLAPQGQENLDAALAGGRGVVLLGAHSGLHGYLALMLFLNLGYPITAAFGEEMESDSSWVYRHMVLPFRRRSRRLFKMIPPSEMPQRDLVELLRQNRILVTLADALDDETFRLAPPNILPIRFYGRRLPLKTSPFRLARWLGAPLVPFFMAPRPEGGFVLSIEPALSLSPDRSPAGLQADLAAYWARFEPYLARYPEQWAHWRHARLPDLFRLAERTSADVSLSRAGGFEPGSVIKDEVP